MIRSIVEYCGVSNGGRCGYCNEEESSKANIGIVGYQLTCNHFNQLLDRGWSRSGRYLYKPIIESTCCPQYTIRLDVNKFTLTRSQKRRLRQINEFLMHDVKPKCKEKYQKDVNCKASVKKPLEHVVKNQKSQQKTGESCMKEKGKKKKLMRRERAIQKMRDNGIDIEEALRKRKAKEEARRRTLKSFLIPYDPCTFKHKLEVRLVSLNSSLFEETFDMSYELFNKYQAVIHSDSLSSKSGFKRFLCDSPLLDDEVDSYGKSVSLGSYHQQYYLDDRLIAVGVTDILPRCLSAKYLFYDPEYEFLSLGTYTALREIAFTKELAIERPDLHFYYMGYYVESCQKMRYKGRFKPSDLLCDTSFTWIPLEKCIEMMQGIERFRVKAFAPNENPAEIFPVDSVSCLYKRKVLTYRQLLSLPTFEETQNFMEEYARIVGPVAQEMCLYRG